MVVYPVVPKDVIMLRIIPTAAHTLEDVQFVNAFAEIQDKLKAGHFKSDRCFLLGNNFYECQNHS
jgi:glycine C-acetyltransferase